MPYSINYDSSAHIVYVIVEGELNLSLLRGIASDVAQHVKKHNCKRILNDMRDAKPTKSIQEIFNMPKQANKSGVTPDIKRALVVSEYSSSFKFLETVFVNQGNTVHLFDCMSTAKSWLAGGNENYVHSGAERD